MITKQIILNTAKAQCADLIRKEDGAELPRLNIHLLPSPTPEFARIVTGIRRCGKSTLIRQQIKQRYKGAFYLNFDDPRLYDFDADAFPLLDEVIMAWQAENKNKRSADILFFDEIQSVTGWEMYIRRKLEAGALVTITGSNATLLSRELGTKLTGRHLNTELFPFSWDEFCKFKKFKKDLAAFRLYERQGGFPEYLKYGNEEILRTLFNDILTRDITVRYGVRDERSLKILAGYLTANCGNLISANKLAAQFSLKTTATVLEYLSHYEQSYLLFLVPKFSNSAKIQAINPKKIYSIDPGLIRAVSTSKTKDEGRIFENIIYLHLRRQNFKICYYADKAGECDFVYGSTEMPEFAIQVCHELTAENQEREISGILSAIKAFPGIQYSIVTEHQKDTILSNGIKISVIPAIEFFK